MSPDIAEINILGTGGGYGESIVVHIGNNQWIVIDSCEDPNSKKCIPLEFLKKRKISLKNVKLILCTHWHDDHILGISKILKEAKDSVFSFARANDQKKFLRLVKLDYRKAAKVSSLSATMEFNQCLDILVERNQPIKNAEVDKLLYSTSFKGINIEIFSLSPSDLSCTIFDEEISELITEYGPSNKKIIKQTPNHRSVVTLIRFGKIGFLFGADLEVKKSNRNLGWHNIIDNSQVVKSSSKAIYFKIPHHGSENGYDSEIFDRLLENFPIGTLTPWNRNKGLPTKEMVKIYKEATSELYITSETKHKFKPKKRDAKATKMIKRFNASVNEVKFQYGLISTTFNILDAQPIFKTNIEGAAKKL